MEFKKEQQRLAEVHRTAWEEDIKEKRRLEKMTEAKDRLAQDIMTRRAAEFARLQVCPCRASLLILRRGKTQV